MYASLNSWLIALLALLLRWCVSYHPYSGANKPPMYGDYEAQRHWQEITLNLPVDQWYINSTNNDLQYWGLDYPPLTAYHSFVLAHVARKVNPEYVELHESRGYESPDHKYFMRLTVLVSDLLVFLPAILYFFKSANEPRKGENIFGFTRTDLLTLTALTYPGIILVDHGHFQYNCVSLGLFVAAVACIFRDRTVFASVLFALALNYKQMELYHALPFFFYILGSHTRGRRKWWSWSLTLAAFAAVVLSTFFLIWLPFLRNSQVFLNVVLRLFPFSRGVFEDKVANFWCTLNVVYKLKNVLANYRLAQVCLATTTMAILPSSVDLYFRPTKEKFLLALINSSLAFFMFSFQVHEKSILLAAVPVLLNFGNDPFASFWFLILTNFSMLPLFIKDDLFLAYLASTVFYFTAVQWMWFDPFLSNGESTEIKRQKKKLGKKEVDKPQFIFKDTHLRLIFCISMLGAIVLSIASKFVVPPKRYPDLFPLLVSVYSCVHFLGFFIYFNYKQIHTLRRKLKVK